MGGQHGSWTVLGAVALCAILGAVSGDMFVPQKITICQEDTDLMKVEIREHTGDDGERLYSGYVFTPVPIDEKFLMVFNVHFPSGDDTYADDPVKLKVPDPCNTWKSNMPSMLKALAAIVNREDPSCPVPKGNYTFTDSPMKIPSENPVLPAGLFKVHVESFHEGKKASCADLLMKLVYEEN